MKKILASLALVGVFAAAPARAEYAPDEELHPYIGIGFAIDNLKYAQIAGADYNAGMPRRFFAPQIELGFKAPRYGFELFYRKSDRPVKDAMVAIPDVDPDAEWASQNSLTYTAMGANLSFLFPQRHGVSLEMLVGAGMYEGDVRARIFMPPAKYAELGTLTEHWNNTLGITLGGGVVTSVIPEVDLRAGLRYTMFSGADFLMDNLREVYLGARVVF